MISGAAAAALVELDPAPQEDRAALFAALAQAGGSASGPVIAGMLAEWAPKPLVLPFVLFVGARRGGDRRRARDPGAGPRRRGPAADRAPERPAGDPRAVRARERHRRGGLGRRRAVPLRRALLRRRPARHLEPGAAGRGQRGDAGHVLRGADRRPPLARPRPHAGRRARRCSPLGLLALVLAFPARSLLVLLLAGPARPAPATGSPSSAPRRSSTSPPRPTAAARSTRPSTR